MDGLATMLDRLQLLKDYLSVNEGLGGDSFIDMRYKALNCDIRTLKKEEEEWKIVENLLVVYFLL